MWTRNEQIAALVYETPLRRDGSYLGMLGQLVPVRELSGRAAVFGATHGLTAFILYGEDRVLAARRGAPLEFISVAEEAGLIDAIGDWTLDRACREVAAWRRGQRRAVTVSVNVFLAGSPRRGRWSPP